MSYFRFIALAILATLGAGAIGAAPAFPVRHSANQRYLVDQTGVPFPIMGRTAWFVTSLSVADYQAFVDDTAARGYSAIELHVINHDPRGNHPPFNGSNAAPFLNTIGGGNWSGSLSYGSSTQAPDFTTPNLAYWSAVDSLLAYCESKGLLVFMFPAYVGAGGGNQGWMYEMEVNGPAKMQSYGAWIADRYKNRTNLVWMAGGDMGSFTTAQSNVESALLTGLRSVAGQQSVEFSAEWTSDMIASDQTQFGNLMTLNSSYSWYSGTNIQGRRAYAHTPTLPAFMLEEPYDEEGPDGNNYNPSATQPVRRFQWWGWLSTIGGYVSGNGYVWPFNPGWKTHLNTQGAQDMVRLNAFMRSIAWYNMVPSGLGGMRTLITAGGGAESASNYVAAAATPDGSLAVAYTPPSHTGSITFDMAALSGPARARWLDPTSSATVDAGTGLANTGQRTFTPPGVNSAGQNDWVLVLDLATPPNPDTTLPTTPTGLFATAASSSQISLTWSASSDNVSVAGYWVERCQGAGCGAFVQIATVTTTSLNDTGLSPATSYSYRVRAADTAGNLSAYSGVSSAATPAPDTIAPTAPGGLSATASSASQISLAWSAASDNVGVAGYRVERCQGVGCSAFVQIATLGITTSFTNTGLSAGTSYSYRVRATDAGGNLGPYSGSASATTSIAPSALAAAYGFGEGTGMTVADASGNNTTGTVSGTTWTTAGRFGNALVFNGSSAFVNLGNPATLQLTGSMTVSAWIKSAAFPGDDAAVVSKRDGAKLGYQLDTSNDTGPRTIGFKLSRTNGSTMARYGASAMQLNQWYYVTGVYDAAAQTLNVYLNGVLDNGTLAGSVGATQQNSPLNVNIGRRPGLSGFAFNGTIDEPRIYGRALTQAEIQSDMATAVGGASPLPDTTPPSAPTGLFATASSASQISLAWSAASDNVGVAGYRVERCQGVGCSAFVQIATLGITTSFNNTGLSAGTSYSYRVRATDAGGNLGPYSGSASATTSIAPSALAAAYGFGEGTGMTVADASGNNTTGTVSGTTWTTAGRFGNALVFNGSSAFVNLGNPATLQLTGSMTVSAWIKSAAFPGDDAAVVSKRNGGNSGYQLDTTKDTGPRTIGFKLTHANGSNMARYGASAMQLNQWYYVTGVYDAAAQTLNVYLNGLLDNGTLLGPVSASQQNSALDVNIGRRTGLSGFAFNGTIDEPRIYGRALTQAEIQSDMATAVGGGP